MSLIYNDRLGASRFPQEYLQCLKALSLRQSSALAIMSGQKDAQKDTNDGHCCCWLLVVGHHWKDQTRCGSVEGLLDPLQKRCLSSVFEKDSQNR